MPRPTRICIPGYPHHVVQRGNNRTKTFFGERDFRKYLKILADVAGEHGSAIHAYVLMTNHVHLLLTPESSDSLSLTMQALGRSYVQYINKCYERTGTLWEGRFKSSIIDSDHYCLACYRYIDLNPVRAGIVTNPLDYPWSSYRYNALMYANDLICPHPTYMELGTTGQARAARYHDLIRGALNESSVNDIRHGIAKGLPVGSDQFKGTVEEYLGYALGTRKVGRPVKN